MGVFATAMAARQRLEMRRSIACGVCEEGGGVWERKNECIGGTRRQSNEAWAGDQNVGVGRRVGWARSGWVVIRRKLRVHGFDRFSDVQGRHQGILSDVQVWHK